jgi:hypothetical protein
VTPMTHPDISAQPQLPDLPDQAATLSH